ncbi:MAG: hypothetical protein WB777_00985 [Mycobacterium sp.]
MTNHRNQPLIRRARRWRIAVGMSAGAVAVAAVLGLSEAAYAHADTGSDVLGQATADLSQATELLDGAPEASLDAQQAAILSEQELFQTGSASSLITEQDSVVSGLPAADQADLTGADDQLTQAYQAVLTADQAFVTADQAGDLSSVQGALPVDLGVLDADIGLDGAAFNTAFADIGAEFANFFDLSALLP